MYKNVGRHIFNFNGGYDFPYPIVYTIHHSELENKEVR